MKIRLAGFNIDKNLIDEAIDSPIATPEVISAAYARISRSSKSIGDLRLQARKELDKARSSNNNIIFEMGHSSIAEHAVFNFDLTGISRLLTEIVQKSRLASFTEKSQRYVTFDNDYVIPTELSAEQRSVYINLMDSLFSEYRCSFEALKEKTCRLPLSIRDQENLAKEDARYILPLATKTQMGMTINARNLEALLRRLSNTPLSEAKELHEKLHSSVYKVAPSLIKYTGADSFYTKDYSGFVPRLPAKNAHSEANAGVRILEYTPNGDDKILAALLYPSAGTDFERLFEQVKAMPTEDKLQIFAHSFEGIKAWHKLPKAFEMCEYTMEFAMSECCWSQFKRHRLCTIIKQSSQPDPSYTIPPAILECKRESLWQQLFKDVEAFANNMQDASSLLPSYLAPNARRVKVLVKMNLREVYHFARLRSDDHAQWEIRNLSRELVPLLKSLTPMATKLLMGKSELELLK